MKKQIIIRATLIAAPAVAVMILALLCFDENGQTPIVEIEAPVRIVETAMPPVSALGATAEPTEDAPAVTAQPEGTNTPPVTNRLGTLTIRGQDISIANNVDEATLDKSPGWMPDSALPGESGMCVILGHRNRKHLRPLEKMKQGGIISFAYPDGRTATYTVTETIIYENTADWRLPAAEGDTLVLVTCWPFRYSGNAPGKYQIICIKN